MSESGNVDATAADRSETTGLRIVVVGGIGAGKSTVTSLFAVHGAVVIEADRIGHAVLGPGGPAAEAVATRWPEVVGADGAIDRSRLADIVFGDLEALAELESYTHPAIRSEILWRAAAAGEQTVLVEVPLLWDWGGEWERVLVTADRAIRLERSVARGAELADVARRISVQPDEDAYRATADHVIVNDGGLDDLHRVVAELWSQFTDR